MNHAKLLAGASGYTDGARVRAGLDAICGKQRAGSLESACHASIANPLT